MNVGIVGSRNYRPVELVEKILDRLEALYDDLTIVSGGEPTGVDNTVAKACRARGYDLPDFGGRVKRRLVEFLPKEKNRQEYFARNTLIAKASQMLIALYADGPLSPGTTDTVTKAESTMLVYSHHEGEWVHN